jgi:Protein of unknown function (DUF3019)
MLSDLARCSGILLCAALLAGLDAHDDAIRLELNPRICTLAAKDRQCSALVHARWQSDHDESLCLVIVGRPDVKRCWEHYTEGIYSIELVFSDDVTFELKDPDLGKVLASDVLRVIREAIHYRRKRHDPWNIFN